MMSQLLMDMEQQMDRIMLPFCSLCRRRVDSFDRISLSAKTRMFGFRIHCHGEVELLEISYDAMLLIPLGSFQPRVFSGVKPSKSEIEFKKSIERLAYKPKEEESKSVRRLLNLEGIK